MRTTDHDRQAEAGPPYGLHGLDSLEAGPCSPSTASPAPSFDRALQELERTEGIQVRSVVGLNDDGVFGATRKDWRPDLPDACHEPFVPLLWLKILELLGSVPEGSTARSLEDGSLPD